MWLRVIIVLHTPFFIHLLLKLQLRLHQGTTLCSRPVSAMREIVIHNLIREKPHSQLKECDADEGDDGYLEKFLGQQYGVNSVEQRKGPVRSLTSNSSS